ncbi:MAG: ABC transporter substrate-binding protein [Fervidobacterium sp.]
MSRYRIIIVVACIILVLVSTVAIVYYLISMKSEHITIRFGTNPISSGHYIPFIVAYEKGWFKEAGIELDIQTFTQGSVHMKAVVARALDMGQVGVSPLVTAIDGGVKIKIIYAYQSGGSLFVVRNGIAIYNVSDFLHYVSENPGQFKLGTYAPGAVQYTIMVDWLTSMGIDYEKDIDFITTVSPPDLPKLLQAGSLDGVFSSYGYLITLLENGDARIITNSLDMWPQHACCAIYATEDFIQEHRSVVKSFVQVLDRAIKWTRENLVEAYKINAEGGWFEGVSPELHLKYGQKSGISWLTSDDHEEILSYIQSTLKFSDTLYQLGLTRHKLNENDLFYLSL